MKQSKSMDETASENIHLYPGPSGTMRRTRNSSRKLRRMEYFNSFSRSLNLCWWGSEKRLLDHYRRIHLSSWCCTKSQTVPAGRRNISAFDEVHWCCWNDIYVTGRNVVRTYWRWLKHGWRKRNIECMDRLHKIHLIEWKATWWVHMVQGGYLQENKQPLAQTLYGQMCGRISLMKRKKKAKQKCAIARPKLGNARQLKGIFLLSQTMKKFKLTIKAARRELEVPMPAAMPCKIPIKSSGETHRNLGKRR